MKWEDRARSGGLGTNWKSVFYGKLTRTTIPKILSVSPLTTKEHPCKVKKKICKAVFSQFMKNSKMDFFFVIRILMQKNKLNLHIYGIHLLNPYKTVVSHLK